jgi:outer membrane protein assembly factor BamB
MRKTHTGLLCMGLMLAAFALPGAASARAYRPAGRPAPPAAGCPDVAHHEDAAHDGYNCSAITAKVRRKWSVTLNGAVSFPLITGGRVFVTTTGNAGGGSLYARSAKTGQVLWGPVALTGNYYLPLTFGGGQVYVSPFEGPVTAFSAATGAQVWATSVSPSAEGEPVAGGGLVWVEGSGDAYGLDEKTGVLNTDTGSLDGGGTYTEPAIKGHGLYFSTGCQKQYGFTVQGIVRWEHNSNCTGGGGGSAAIWNGRMYGSDWNEILATSDGTQLGTFLGTPAFSGTTGFFAFRRTLSALDVADNNKPVWTATLRASISAGPIATTAAVWVGTHGSRLLAISPATGAVLASYKLPGVPGAADGNSLTPADIGIGNNLIVVPTESTLTAFGG